MRCYGVNNMKNKNLLLAMTIICIIVIGTYLLYQKESNIETDKVKADKVNETTETNEVNETGIINETETDKVNETGSSVYSNTISDGAVMIINNVWGATDKEKDNKTLNSYIYKKDNGNFGWEWNRPDPRPNSGTYIPPIYPEVIIGAAHESSYFTTDIFPISYKDIESWTSEVEFQYVKTPKGEYNFAYDIYFVDPSNSDKKLNVMIWISGHLDNDEPIKYVSDGINEYEYHHRDPVGNQYWAWYAFILNDQDKYQGEGRQKFKVDIKKLLEQIPQERFNDDWIVRGIEVGNEIYRGSGRIEISKYAINLNGDAVQS